MNIDYLKLFEEVASTGSISKVASSSHLSQPALSQQIQRFEEELGYKLLTRSNRGVELTKSGVIVNKHAKNIIKSYQNMLEDLYSLGNNKKTLRIDCTPAVATYAMPCAVYKIEEKFPHIKIELNTNHSDKIENSVLNNYYDVGFITDKPKEKELIGRKIFVDRVVSVAANNFKINEEVTLEDFCQYPLIMLNENYTLRQLIEQKLIKAGCKQGERNIRFILDTIESVKSTVIKGFGVSFLPYLSIKKELYTKQLKVINIINCEMYYDIFLIYKKEDHQNKDLRNFIDLFEKIGPKAFC